LVLSGEPGTRVAALGAMATRRPALHALSACDRLRGRAVEQEVSAIVRRHLDDACERAWAEIAGRFGAAPLFPAGDPTTPSARRATAALVTLITRGISRLAVAALLLGTPRPRLTALVGGARRNGHAATGGRADQSSSSR
ncbi:MAG TPA: hypothetical protein VFL90_03820, partial [Methylomirabilota bacterium]|nr:hypothetical protein [Methylomirabilota bacterium]